jgi:hypothetical protein
MLKESHNEHENERFPVGGSLPKVETQYEYSAVNSARAELPVQRSVGSGGWQWGTRCFLSVMPQTFGVCR